MALLELAARLLAGLVAFPVGFIGGQDPYQYCEIWNATPTKPMSVQTFCFDSDIPAGDCISVKVYWKQGPYTGPTGQVGDLFEPAGWTIMCEGEIASAGPGADTVIPAELCQAHVIVQDETRSYNIVAYPCGSELTGVAGVAPEGSMKFDDEVDYVRTDADCLANEDFTFSPTSSPTSGPTASTPGPTASASSATSSPTASTSSPTASTPGPTASTSSPTASTSSPTASTPGPTASTSSPTASTSSPTASTSSPTASTPGPTASTSSPTASTSSPTASTPSPTADPFGEMQAYVDLDADRYINPQRLGYGTSNAAGFCYRWAQGATCMKDQWTTVEGSPTHTNHSDAVGEEQACQQFSGEHIVDPSNFQCCPIPPEGPYGNNEWFRLADVPEECVITEYSAGAPGGGCPSNDVAASGTDTFVYGGTEYTDAYTVLTKINDASPACRDCYLVSPSVGLYKTGDTGGGCPQAEHYDKISPSAAGGSTLYKNMTYIFQNGEPTPYYFTSIVWCGDLTANGQTPAETSSQQCQPNIEYHGDANQAFKAF